MSQLGEMVAVVADVDTGWQCPFEHRPKTHNKKNYMPPPESNNNAKKLSDALDAESKGVANIPITFQHNNKQRKEDVQFTAHHIIPGNESWPSSQLFKWMQASEGHICADIGYDVNAATNGVDLPGHTGVPWSDEGFQKRFAMNAIVADSKKRQFHDRHAAYSDFVVNVLNKIATKLDAKVPKPGCGKKNCGGAKTKPYDPPYALLARLEAAALSLEKKVTGDSRRWKKPIMTSRFALMFSNKGLSQDQARKELETDQFVY